MNATRRAFLHLAAGAAIFPGRAWAQTYPERAVRVLVGTAAGSAPDTVARIMAQWLSEHLGQPFVIENRPGAGGNIAAEVIAHAPPDGYSLLFVTSANAIDWALYDKLNFSFTQDIAPVAGIIRMPFVIVVNPSLPARTVPELIAYAKANPGKIVMASDGNGTLSHVAGELFKMLTGVDMLHVPYRSGPPALTDLIGGRVQVMFEPVAASIGFIRSGKLRPLAVTSAARAALLPDLPTVGDFVPDYEATAAFGLGVPRNTPGEIVRKLGEETNIALASPAIATRFAELGGTPLPMGPAEYGRLIAVETEKWAKVLAFSGVKAE